MNNEAIYKFSVVGQLAVVQELKVRLLANKIKDISRLAFEKSVFETEKAVVDFLTGKGLLSEDEAKQITNSRKIRNKLLHCELKAAIKLIFKVSGKEPIRADVKVMKFDESDSGESLLAKIMDFEKLAEPISGMSMKQAGLFGWLLQASHTGALDYALELFEATNALLDKLTADVDERR